MEDWRIVRVADVAARSSNALATGPFGSSIGSRFFRRSGVPVIRGGNLSADSAIRINDDDLVFLAPEKAAEFSRSTVRRGDLIFTSWGTIDQVGLIDDSASFDDYVISNKQMKLSPDPGIALPDFLYYLFSAPAMQREILAGAIGSSIPGFNLTRLRSIEIELPPIQEQQKIVDALSDVENLEKSLRRLIAKKLAIMQGMMQQLLTGRIRLPGFQEAWVDKNLGDLLQRSPRYGINAAAVKNAAGVYPYIRITDIDDDGHFAPSPKMAVRHPKAAEYLLQAGDIVLARTGASVGKSYLYDPFDGDLVYAGFLINIKPDPAILDARYLAFYARTPQYWSWVARTSVRSGQPGINGREYSQLALSLPEIREQRAIADALTDADREIDILRDRFDKAHAMKQGMMQQLLTGRTRLPV